MTRLACNGSRKPCPNSRQLGVRGTPRKTPPKVRPRLPTVQRTAHRLAAGGPTRRSCAWTEYPPFFEKYGGKTIALARFVPIVRTFAPFVAGVGSMTYSRFIYYNITGALLWVGLLLYAGYFFGSHPLVEKNFGLVIIAIIVLSILPAAWEFVRARRAAKSGAA